MEWVGAGMEFNGRLGCGFEIHDIRPVMEHGRFVFDALQLGFEISMTKARLAPSPIGIPTSRGENGLGSQGPTSPSIVLRRPWQGSACGRVGPCWVRVPRPVAWHGPVRKLGTIKLGHGMTCSLA